MAKIDRFDCCPRNSSLTRESRPTHRPESCRVHFSRATACDASMMPSEELKVNYEESSPNWETPSSVVAFLPGAGVALVVGDLEEDPGYGCAGDEAA